MLRGPSRRTREGLSSRWTTLRVASSRTLPTLVPAAGAAVLVEDEVARITHDSSSPGTRVVGDGLGDLPSMMCDL
jgi:hypothetical protein